MLAGCAGSESSAVEDAIPRLEGDDLPKELINSYHDSGEASVGWHFLSAGDPFCRETVHTVQSCLRITRPSGTVDYGPAVVAGDEIVISLIYDEDGNCLREWRVAYTLSGDHLDLHHGVCDVPRGPLILGSP
jgi:hypothetical protein